MCVRIIVLILLVLVCSCTSPGERLAQVLEQSSSESCADRERDLNALWVDGIASLIRTALTKSEKWQSSFPSPLRAEANTGNTAFEAALSEVQSKPAVVFGNQSASMGRSCERARAHLTVHNLELEALTSMSACIQLPRLGRKCDKTKVRLVGRAGNAMISVNIRATSQGFILVEPDIEVRLSELSLSQSSGDIMDQRASTVFSRFQPSWEDAIAQVFEEGLKGAIRSAISELNCDLEAMSCN